MKLSDYLSRVTSAGTTYVPQIDGLRFLAIMWVIAYHVRAICSFHFHVPENSAAATGDLVNNAFGAGAYGVQLFFAISGFVLALPFAKQHLGQGAPVRLRAYYVRRLTRLEPPYIIHLLFLFVFCWLVLRHFPSHPYLYQNSGWAGYALTRLFVSLFYANGFLFGSHPYPNSVLWSLEVEVQFYILAPLLSLLFCIAKPGLRRSVIVGLIVCSSAVTCAIGPVYRMWASLAGNLHFFLIGFLLCDGYLTAPVAPADRKRIWDFLFLAAGGSFILLYEKYFVIAVVYPWLIYLCCSAALRGKICSSLFGWIWITTIGGMCYTIYMYHFFMISALVRVTGRLQTHVFWLDLLIQFVVMSAAIVLASAVLFKLFERPFMQRGWHTKLWQRIRAAGKPASTVSESTAAK